MYKFLCLASLRKSPGPHVKDQELNPRPHTPRPAEQVEQWLIRSQSLVIVTWRKGMSITLCLLSGHCIVERMGTELLLMPFGEGIPLYQNAVVNINNTQPSFRAGSYLQQLKRTELLVDDMCVCSFAVMSYAQE